MTGTLEAPARAGAEAATTETETPSAAEAAAGPRFVTSGPLPPVQLGEGAPRASASDRAYGHGGPHDDPSNPIRHAFWVATYNGDTLGEFAGVLAAAEANMRERALTAHVDADACVDIVRMRLHDMRKLHDNVKLHGKDWVNADRFVATIDELNAWQVLAGNEKAIILDAFRTLLARGALRGVTDPTAGAVLHAAEVMLGDAMYAGGLHAVSLDGVAEEYRPALLALRDARLDDNNPLTAAQRIAKLDTGMRQLAPLLAKQPDPALRARADQLRERLAGSVAHDRVEAAEVTRDGDVVERSAEQRAESRGLREQLKAVDSNLTSAVEILKAAHAEQIETAIKKLGARGGPMWKNVSAFNDISNLLGLVDGLLILSDDKLAEELGKHQDVFGRISTFAELGKAIAEIIAGLMTLVANLAGALDHLAGAASLARRALRFSRLGGERLGNLAAVLEITKGLATLASSEADAAAKEKAGFDTTLAVGQLIGGAAGATVMLSAVAVYGELNIAAYISHTTREAITSGTMAHAFARMAQAAPAIEHELARILKANKLWQEAEPDMKPHFATEIRAGLAELAMIVQDFVATCRSTSYLSAPDHPGAYLALRPIFEGIAGAQVSDRDPVVLAEVAKTVLEKIGFCLQPANRARLERSEAGA